MTLGRRLLAFALVVGCAFLVLLTTVPQATLEACRVLNVPLGFGVAAGFFIRVNDAWARYGLGGRIVRAGVLLLMLVAAAGSAEAYVRHAELGFRAAGLTLALATCAVGLVVIGHDD